MRPDQPPGGTGFLLTLALAGGTYVLLVAALIVALVSQTTPTLVGHALLQPEIQYAARLSLVSAGITALGSLWVGVPLGYLLARVRFPGRALVEVLVDVPLVLPPLVVGVGLLVLFQSPLGLWLQRGLPVTYQVPAVLLAQFTVSAALAVRTLRVAFAQTAPRTEQVALTLGCTRWQAFWWVALPEVKAGVVAAGTLAGVRALGEFGPVLIFAGATRLRTEVLPTSVYLEMSTGQIEAALAVSVLLLSVAGGALLILRLCGLRV
jgi:molybdate transport system permease protein